MLHRIPSQKKTITISAAKVKDVLGICIADEKIENIFNALKFKWTRQKNNWAVDVPSYRLDITLPEDLIEEIARLYGYDKIPVHQISGELTTDQTGQSKDLTPIKHVLRDLGYHEVISYSFITKALQKMLDPEHDARELLNPITADMAVMRTNLWPGLVTALLYNKARQQHRVRLFEIGTCFVSQENELQQHPKLGGVISGYPHPEQWGIRSREVDFYDLKGDIQALLKLFYGGDEVLFKPGKHPALHPGQTAAIYHHQHKIGIFGALPDCATPRIITI